MNMMSQMKGGMTPEQKAFMMQQNQMLMMMSQMNPGEQTMDPAKVVTAGGEPTPAPEKALPSLTNQGPKQAFMTNSAFFSQADRNGVQADLEHPNDYPG